MDYNQLEYFLKVCEEKSIRKAAEKLHLSQQALSKAVANLEKELEVPLFLRTRQGVEPTVYGSELAQQALSYLDTHNRIIKRLHALRDAQPVQTLKIGFFAGMLQALPPHFLAAFMDAHPELSLQLHSYADNERNRCFQNYDCDLVMTTAPLLSPNFVPEFCHSRPVGILLRADHPLAAASTLRLSDLQGQHIITLNSDNRAQTALSELLRRHDIPRDTILSDAEWELTRDLLLRGYLSFYAGKVSVLPTELTFRPVSDLDVQWEFYVYVRSGHQLSAAARELIASVRKNIADTP